MASREEVVKVTSQSDTSVEDEGLPRDWARLICKLRWIGLEDEARRPATSRTEADPGRARERLRRTVQY